jgi:hypothetical protein
MKIFKNTFALLLYWVFGTVRPQAFISTVGKASQSKDTTSLEQDLPIIVLQWKQGYGDPGTKVLLDPITTIIVFNKLGDITKNIKSLPKVVEIKFKHPYIPALNVPKNFLLYLEGAMLPLVKNLMAGLEGYDDTKKRYLALLSAKGMSDEELEELSKKMQDPRQELAKRLAIEEGTLKLENAPSTTTLQ